VRVTWVNKRLLTYLLTYLLATTTASLLFFCAILRLHMMHVKVHSVTVISKYTVLLNYCDLSIFTYSSATVLRDFN